MQEQNFLVGDTPKQTVKNVASATALVQAAMNAEMRDELPTVGYWGVHLLCNCMMDAALLVADNLSDKPGGNT